LRAMENAVRQGERRMQHGVSQVAFYSIPAQPRNIHNATSVAVRRTCASAPSAARLVRRPGRVRLCAGCAARQATPSSRRRAAAARPCPKERRRRSRRTAARSNCWRWVRPGLSAQQHNRRHAACETQRVTCNGQAKACELQELRTTCKCWQHRHSVE
jgi:hypothetical protein